MRFRDAFEPTSAFDVPRETADKPMTLLAEILLDGKSPPLRIEGVK